MKMPVIISQGVKITSTSDEGGYFREIFGSDNMQPEELANLISEAREDKRMDNDNKQI
tara:strand:- start:195 stop:368 length:174 start_codon:yes stop_codon:yes gene_type:complete